MTVVKRCKDTNNFQTDKIILVLYAVAHNRMIHSSILTNMYYI